MSESIPEETLIKPEETWREASMAETINADSPMVSAIRGSRTMNPRVYMCSIVWAPMIPAAVAFSRLVATACLGVPPALLAARAKMLCPWEQARPMLCNVQYIFLLDPGPITVALNRSRHTRPGPAPNGVYTGGFERGKTGKVRSRIQPLWPLALDKAGDAPDNQRGLLFPKLPLNILMMQDDALPKENSTR